MTAVSLGQYLLGTLIGIVPGVAIYVYFGIFGHGLGNGPKVLDWALLGCGIVATVAFGVIVTRKTRQLFEVSERRRR